MLYNNNTIDHNHHTYTHNNINVFLHLHLHRQYYQVQWASIMQEVTGLKILWMGLIASIVPQEAQVELKELKDTQWGDSQGVRYMMFIDSLKKKNVEAQRPRSKRSCTFTFFLGL